MSQQSALEGLIAEIGLKLKLAIAAHDRFVILFFIFAFVPIPYACLISLVASFIHLYLVKTLRLSKTERPLIMVTMMISLIIIAGWSFLFFALYRTGVSTELGELLRNWQLYPFMWLKNLLFGAPRLEPPRTI